MGIREICHDGNIAAKQLARKPIKKAQMTVDGTRRIVAVQPVVEFGGGGIGMPIDETRDASEIPITTPKILPMKPMIIVSRIARLKI